MSITDDERQAIVDQIGRMNILSISGGRVIALSNGVRLPVSSGISVVVIYNVGADDYTVKREFCRKVNGVDTIFDHGQRTHVYCDQLAETAYVAGMYKSYSKESWMSEAARRV